jgi:hypothetical protein
MGVVLKGRDVDLGRDVAVKVLLERHLDKPEMVRRFIEEAQIGGQLQHPGIVPVYELGRLPDARLYIAMKLIRGRTLAELLEGRADPTAGRAQHLSTFEQVCQAVAYAHACGVVHRDLKPSNVMVGSFGEVYVMDWGLAKVLDRGGIADEERSLRGRADEEPVRTLRTGSTADDSRAGSVLGTPTYMAPEQARGQLDTLDERADVFGLGAMLCEILTGLPPYTGANGNEVYRKAERADLGDALARLDACGAEAELVALAKSCLVAPPRDRPRNAGVVAAALSAHLAGVQERLKVAELARVRAEARAAEERKRRLLVVGLAASLFALVVLVGGGGLWLARQRAARLEAADRRMVEKLTAIHSDMALHLDYARADREHASAFQEYGIDVDRLQPADAGARIAAAPIAVEMVDALDQWAFIRRTLAKEDAPGARHLSAVAQAADPDPWRCRLRGALDLESTDRAQARTVFEELAATAPQDALHRESLSRLAFALGKTEAATSLLRRAQRAHPDDFWINYDLARSLMGTGRPDEAARYLTAAVAIRPRSDLALRGLREALRAAARPE